MPQTDTTATEHVMLAAADAAAVWADHLQALAAEAWRLAAQRLDLEPPARVRVISFGLAWEFERYLGFKPSHVVAVSRPAQGEIVILRPELFSTGRDAQLQTLVHEMAHLTAAAHYAGELPAWLDEGLAMLTARQSDYEYAMRLAMAGTLGGLLPIEQLESSVLLGGESQTLAYAQSLSLTRYYLRRQFPGESDDGNDPRPLARALADPLQGPRLLAQLRDPNFRRALEHQWIDTQKTLWNWLAALSGGGFMWGVLSPLFLLAWWRKRRMARLVRERLAIEDERDRELGLEPPPWEYEAEDAKDEHHPEERR